MNILKCKPVVKPEPAKVLSVTLEYVKKNEGVYKELNYNDDGMKRRIVTLANPYDRNLTTFYCDKDCIESLSERSWKHILFEKVECDIVFELVEKK